MTNRIKDKLTEAQEKTRAWAQGSPATFVIHEKRHWTAQARAKLSPYLCVHCLQRSKDITCYKCAREIQRLADKKASRVGQGREGL